MTTTTQSGGGAIIAPPIIQHLLTLEEYFNEVTVKDTIYVHHTAGSHRPDWTIDGWERDKSKSGGVLKVGTAYVIGGKSISKPDNSFDGKIYQAFDDKFWCHHLGTTSAKNVELNKKSIGIEICNYGPLTKTRDGVFINYVNNPVPASDVIELPAPFRGFKYYHKYTDAQVQALVQLVKYLAAKHPQIKLNLGLPALPQVADSLEVKLAAQLGKPGIWSHTSVRKDKFDFSPQPSIMSAIWAFKL